MRLMRLRQVILVVASMLGFAAPAHADCAWVLWQDVPSKSGRWRLDAGAQVVFPTREASQQQLNARSEFLNEVNRTATASGAPFLVCLPDTVDPRGPKVR